MTTNRERQSAELVLLESMYPTEFAWRSDSLADLSDPACADPACSLQLHPFYTLDLSLPAGYPADSKPHVYVSCAGEVDTARRKRARAALSKLVEEQESGIEILDLLVTGFSSDLLPGITAQEHEARHDNDGDKARRIKTRFKRVVIWSHHLLATSKRRDILTWSKELLLSGYSRPGYPGAVFAEGEEDQVDEFVRRLKALRWQALQVRGEETGETRLCGDGQGVREVEGLGDIAEGLKARNEACATLFLEGMKIAKTE